MKIPAGVHEPLMRHPYTAQCIKSFHIDLYLEMGLTFHRPFYKAFLRTDKNEIGTLQQPLLQFKKNCITKKQITVLNINTYHLLPDTTKYLPEAPYLPYIYLYLMFRPNNRETSHTLCVF